MANGQPSVIDMLLGNIRGLPSGGPGLDPRVMTPGINPSAPDIRTQVQPKGTLGKLDGFLNSQGGGLLMNLLAQSGYSTMPQSPFGAIGRATLANQEQQTQRKRGELEEELLRARIGLAGSGGDLPSDVRSFREFEKLGDPDNPNVLTPAQKRFIAVKRAQEIRDIEGLGLSVLDPVNANPTVVTGEETIVGGIRGRAGAREAGAQEAQIAAIPERLQTTAETERQIKAQSELPSISDKTSRVTQDGQEIIRQLESGELKTGFFRGQLPAITTNEQLFDVFSGDQVLEKISSATFGALSEGEREFLRTTVSSRTKTPEANIDIIKRKISILEGAERRARVMAGEETPVKRRRFNPNTGQFE